MLKSLIIRTLTTPIIDAIGHRLVSTSIPIFMLHRFKCEQNPDSGTDPAHLRTCLAYLAKNKYNFLSLKELALALRDQTPLPRKSVAFTIDDGFADQLEVGARIFLEYDCPVTVFLITGMIDGELWPWDDQVSYAIRNATNKKIKLLEQDFSIANSTERKTVIGNIQNLLKSHPATELPTHMQQLALACGCDIPRSAPEQYRPATWEMARAYEAKGLEFGAHTVSHRILSQLDDASARDEILISQRRLREEIKNPSPVFCYPTGRASDFTKREFVTLAETGFIASVATTPASLRVNSLGEIHALPRVSFSDDFSEFVHDATWIGRLRN